MFAERTIAAEIMDRFPKINSIKKSISKKRSAKTTAAVIDHLTTGVYSLNCNINGGSDGHTMLSLFVKPNVSQALRNGQLLINGIDDLNDVRKKHTSYDHKCRLSGNA